MTTRPIQWVLAIILACAALPDSAHAQTIWTQAVLPGAPFPSDIQLTSQTSGTNQFNLTPGAGGSLARMRANRENNKELIPFGISTTDSNAQWSLTAGTALDDGNAATDDRFHLRQAGGAGNRLAPVMQVEQDAITGKVDVYAVAQDQWSAHLRSAVQSKVSHLTRYEPLSDGSVKVRRIIRFGDAAVNGTPFDISAPLYENLHSFHVGNFNALAEKLQTTGAPDVFYQQGSNIPQNQETDVALTEGYGVVYNSADTVNRAAVGVVFGKTQMAAPNQMVVNYADSTTAISVRPGIHLTNAAPGSILDVTYFLVPSHGLNSTFKTRLDDLVASVPLPVIYPSGHAFTGELATIAQRLNDNLALPGIRTDRLGHDVTPAPIAARPMLLNGPEDDADIRARLVAFPQTPENVLQNYLYGSAADKQAATNYFFRYPGSGDGDGLRTNYNTITARHMMWDQYRYDIALGLGYATVAQKNLMLSLTESFIASKSTHIRPDGTGGGNLALEAYIAIGLAGLNFPDHPDAQFWISRSVTNVKKVVDTYFPDGAGTESPRYHDWSLELLAMYLRALERRAGIDLYDEPGIRSALEWLIRFSSPPVSLTSNKSVTPSWGDSTYSSNAGTHYYYNLGLFAPYYRERDPDFSGRLMGWWIRNGRPRDLFSASTSGLTNILMLDSRIPDAPVRPNTSTYSPRIGHATLRSGSGTDDEFFASFKCGTQGAAHQDADIGHIDLFAFGVPLALDSTSGPYDTAGAFNPAIAAHNGVRFNGVGAWDSVSGSFSAFGTSAIADYAVGDTNYGTVSNRHLVMMKGDYLVVWDETTASNYADWFFRFPGSATLDWQDHKVVSSTPWGVNLDVHFVLPAEPLVEPTFSGSFIPTGDATALRNQLASQATDPGAPGMFTMMGENRFGDGSTTRNPFPFQWLKYISVRNASSAGDFLTVMHPRKVGVTPEITTELVSSSATAVTLRVTCNGRIDTIALTSTGATITKGNEPPVQFTKSWPQSGVSGAAAYVKSDFHTAPVTTLTNEITTTGPVEVHTGELALGSANRIPNSATLMVKPGAAFNTATYNETVGTLLMNGGVLKGSGTLTASSIEWWGGIVTAPVSSSGNFVKKGGTDWSRPANITYSGDTVIESGNLAFQPGGPALPGTGRVVLANGTGLNLNGAAASITQLDVTGNATLTDGTLSVTQSLTGTGTLTNTGNLDLSGVSTISPTVSLATTGTLTLPAGAWSVKRLIINGVIQRAGVLVNASSHPGLVSGAGSITALEDIPVPTGLSATATLGQVNLTWDSNPGVPSYVVRRATTPGGPYSDIGTPAAANFADTLVTDGITYYYVVAARDAYGDSTNSNEVSVTAIGPWYFDPNGTTAGSVANGGSYDWVTNSWTKTPGGTASTEASGLLRHVQFSATNPGLPLAYSVAVGSNFSGASHGFRSLRITQGMVTFTGVPGNFYFTQPPLITADAGTTIRFAQTGALAFNLNGQNVTFDGAGTTLVSNDTVIMNGGSITKSGTGTLVLAAPNIYSGATTINGGTLRLAVTDLPALWLDATNARTLTTTDGLLERWGDSNGRDTFVSQSTAANRPALITDPALAGRARSLVDFGAYIYNATTAPWMQFGADMTDIRALFWVGKTDNNNFLLGSTATHYNFHSAGSGSNIWRNNYASPNIINGTTWLNGTAVSGTNTIMPSQDNLVRIGAFTAGNVNANTLGRDRTYRTGGIRPGEVMIFNTTLTSQQQTDIDAYLAKKWSNNGAGIGNRLPVSTVVSLSNGGVLDLTGINFQTVAGLNSSDNSATRVDLGAARLTIDGPDGSTFDGSITGSGELVKSGVGTFALEGTSTYSGPTTVNAGSLILDGSITSNVTVKTGAVLVNNGTITGNLLVEAGGVYQGEGSISGTVSINPPVVWTSTDSGSWTTGANWSAGIAPASHPATQLEFLTNINPGPVSITANNDNPGNFQLNSLTLSGIHTAPATTVILTGNPLEFSSSAGALPGINLTTDSSSFTYQIDNPLVLSADTTIDSSSPGNMVLKGIISGPGGLTRSGSAGSLVLAGNNTYTGPTIINSGTLKLADVILPTGLQIMPMGDSITYGDQGSDAGYRGPLYNLLNPVAPGFNFVGSLSTVQANVSLPPAYLHHEGHSGWTAAQLTAGNFLAPGNGVNPDVILLQIGTNDLLAAGYTAQLQTNLETLLTQLTTNRPAARILLAKITPTTNRNGVASYNAMVATVAANFQAAGKLVTLVDNNTNFPALGLADGTHPNDAGYQWLAGNWFDAIATLYSTGGTSSALATSSSVTLAQSATLDLNYNSANIGALAGEGTVLLRSGALVAASGTNSQFSGTIAGPGSFTKGGTGTLTLSGPNTYGGGTAVSAGTLQINSGGSLGSASGALALGTGASGVIGTVGNLTVLGNGNAGAMSVRQNTATLTGNDIAALTIANSATLGTASLDIGVLGNNQRTALATGAANSGGTLAVTGDVTIGKQNTGNSYQSVDFSGLATFTAGSGSGNVFRVGYGALNEATLTLASTSNTINVGTLSIGETVSLGNSGRNNILNLGQGTNTLQTANLKIGAQKASGVLRFTGSAGTVTLTGPGGTGTASITLGDNSSASYQPGTLNNQLLLAGHQATVSAGAVIIGRKSGGGAGNVTAAVTFDTGTFDTNSISMAVATSGNAGTVVTGSLTLGTTPASTGILTVANDFVLAANTFSTNAVSTVGSLNIIGGTATIHGNLKNTSTTTSATSTTSLTLNGGTLDMTNGSIGGNASGNRPITNLLFQSGILKNVAQINGGSAGLSKSSSGTLEIAGVNSYTGPTTIADGTLLLSGSLASDLTAAAGTLTLQGTPSTTGSLAISSGGTFAPSPGNTLSIGGSVTLAGNLAFTAPSGLAPGSSFTILNKTSAGLISGAFSGKPEGTTFAASGYNWQITYTGGDGNDVVVSLPTALDAWRMEHFGSIENSGSGANEFDADDDGESNLLEFATGQNPKSGTRSQTGVSFVPAGIDFTYQRNRDAVDSGWIFTVEYSDTLADPWTSVGPGSVLLDGPPQSVRATIPEGDGNHRFIRLRVTAP